MTTPTPAQPRHVAGGRSIDIVGEDLLQNILTRLPAGSFASAACVSRSWNLVSRRILCRPKLSSAISLNHSLQVAAEEVLINVLSEPIRPHFAIASVGPSFNLQQAHQLITRKLGSKTPVITTCPAGIMGRVAVSNEFREIQWEVTDDVDSDVLTDVSESSNRAIMLVVGFLPGLKVSAIPLLKRHKELQCLMVDKFVMDIREYTASISGLTSPTAIIMFGDCETGMKPMLEKIDYAMSPETVVVGDASCQFLYRSDSEGYNNISKRYSSAAVALVFASYRDKPRGIGETRFHATLSSGLSPVGPSYKAASVREKYSECVTWLTARREGFRENLDGETIISQIYDELEARIQYPTFYIGVTKRRKCSIGLDKVGWIMSHAFHDVLGDNQEYLFVGDIGIKTGDSFQFYRSDSTVAISSSGSVSDRFRLLKQDCNNDNSHRMKGGIANGNKTEVFGGILFSCCGRGEPFFGQPNVDSSPFLDNFPGVTLAGSFCGGEICRGDSSSYYQESQEKRSVRCCLHAHSAVYLVMSYTLLPEN